MTVIIPLSFPKLKFKFKYLLVNQKDTGFTNSTQIQTQYKGNYTKTSKAKLRQWQRKKNIIPRNTFYLH